MKYIRRFITLIIGVIFFAAAIISVGMIFAVKNINVTLLAYSDDVSGSYAELKSTLSSFKGEIIAFVGQEEIVESVEKTNYTVVSCEKILPCTINVTLKERLETFAVSVGGQYAMYDIDGKYLRYDNENENIGDGAPNIVLSGIAVEEIGEFAEIAGLFKEKFEALRSVVSGIRLDRNEDIDGYPEKLFFLLRCGLTIEIDNYADATEEKISAAYEKFISLTDRQKLSGTLRSYRLSGTTGEIRADYTSL